MNGAVRWVRDRTGGDYINIVIVIITERVPNAATNGFVPSHRDSSSKIAEICLKMATG